MHREMCANAVSCAVEIVHTLTPYHAACYGIYLCSRGTIRELQRGKGYMSFKYQRVSLAHIVRQRSESYCSRNICSAIGILCAAVY